MPYLLHEVLDGLFAVVQRLIGRVLVDAGKQLSEGAVGGVQRVLLHARTRVHYDAEQETNMISTVQTEKPNIYLRLSFLRVTLRIQRLPLEETLLHETLKTGLLRIFLSPPFCGLSWLLHSMNRVLLTNYVSAPSVYC